MVPDGFLNLLETLVFARSPICLRMNWAPVEVLGVGSRSGFWLTHSLTLILSLTPHICRLYQFCRSDPGSFFFKKKNNPSGNINSISRSRIFLPSPLPLYPFRSESPDDIIWVSHFFFPQAGVFPSLAAWLLGEFSVHKPPFLSAVLASVSCPSASPSRQSHQLIHSFPRAPKKFTP